MNELQDELYDEIGLAEDGNQFLTFLLAGEEYGVQILKVQEIKGFSAITPIPNTPAFIKGAMNLRGTVVPVVDLRERFGMVAGAYDRFTVIIVVMVGERIVGLVVDAVSDVLSITEEEIAPPPPLGHGVDTTFMTGMAKSKDKFVLILDIDAVLGEEMAAALPAA